MPTVLITGANRGLGLEFVGQYARDGWAVIACCRAPEKAEALQALAKTYTAIRIEALDVADDKSIAALAAKLDSMVLDVLINNAGILSGELTSSWGDNNDAGQIFGSLNAPAWEKVLRVNSIAPVLLSQALLPHIKKGKQRKIVMISSEAGSITNMSQAGHLAYRTSKAALNTAMRNMAFTLDTEGVIVASLHPGWVQTDMGGKQGHLTPEQSVSGLRQIIAALKQENSGQFLGHTGQIIPW